MVDRRFRADRLSVLFLVIFTAVIHAGPSFAARYVDNRDGTVTDSRTGLVWQKTDDGVIRD